MGIIFPSGFFSIIRILWCGGVNSSAYMKSRHCTRLVTGKPLGFLSSETRPLNYLILIRQSDVEKISLYVYVGPLRRSFLALQLGEQGIHFHTPGASIQAPAQATSIVSNSKFRGQFAG